MGRGRCWVFIIRMWVDCDVIMVWLVNWGLRVELSVMMLCGCGVNCEIIEFL